MIHDPLCHNPEPMPDGMACGWCWMIKRVRRAIIDGLKAGLPESDTRDSAVAIATFAASAI
jgi:hypothetical protein